MNLMKAHEIRLITNTIDECTSMINEIKSGRYDHIAQMVFEGEDDKLNQHLIMFLEQKRSAFEDYLEQL